MTQSVFAKADGISYIQIAPSTGFSSRYQNFDLSTGQLGTGDVDGATITAYPDGWYRCTVTQLSTGSSGRMVIALLLLLDFKVLLEALVTEYIFGALNLNKVPFQLLISQLQEVQRLVMQMK